MSQRLLTPEQDADQVEKICHDLKQHIATGLLLSEGSEVDGLVDEARSRLKILHQQFEHAADLVAILRHETSEDTQQADLAEVARDAVAAAPPTHSISLQVVGREHLVPSESVLLRRAVVNLIDNACRAATATGHVTVRVGGSGTERWVEVGDDGPGFGEIAAGTGLGLPIVRSAVWASGGRLLIDTGPGLGTTIRMTFPARLLVVGCD